MDSKAMSLIRTIKSIMFFLKKKKVVAHYKIFNVDEWLLVSISSVVQDVHKIVITISDQSWGDSGIEKLPDNKEKLDKFCKLFPGKIVVNSGSWSSQIEQVQAGLDFIKSNFPEATHCLYVDSDEVFERQELKKLLALTSKSKYFNREIRIHWHSYFKTPYYRIEPEEDYNPMVLFPIRKFTAYTTFRNVNFGHVVENIWFHHMSYVRKNDDDIRNKMLTHKEDEGTEESWYEKVYLKWTPETTDFHPVIPSKFHQVKIVTESDLPEQVVMEYRKWTVAK